MAMKKKRNKKELLSKFKGRNPALKKAAWGTGPLQESSPPVLTCIGRSVGVLLGRPRAFFKPAGKTEA
jgi:hypothetical protein